MPQYKYLIIGGGMTADAAAQGIREVDYGSSIGLIGDDPDPPYSRPPLSKALWRGEPLDSVWRKTADRGVELHLGRRAVTLDAKAKRVTDDHGTSYGYDRLLLATGGAVRRLPFGGDDVIYFRTFGDYRRLRVAAYGGARCLVIGGGFIGTEVAAALRRVGLEVTMVVPEAGIGARVYPPDLSRFLVEYYREQGVDVRTGQGVTAIQRRNGRIAVRLSSGETVTAKVAVAGIGITPEVSLAEQAGLQVDNGIVVDELLRTSQPDIYAAGDVANFHSVALDRRVRVEHEDNALTMGHRAGANMAGRPEPYRHLPFFYSDLFDLGYEAVGDLDARHETIADWKEPFREGVVYYVARDRVRGVLLWNTWGQVDAARALIAEAGPITAASLKGRLP